MTLSVWGTVTAEKYTGRGVCALHWGHNKATVVSFPAGTWVRGTGSRLIADGSQEGHPLEEPASLTAYATSTGCCVLLTPKLAPVCLCLHWALPEVFWAPWELPLKWSIVAGRLRAWLYWSGNPNPLPFSHIPAMVLWTRSMTALLGVVLLARICPAFC